MEANRQLISHFYTCFKNKDYKGMQACYSNRATFNDAVFTDLNAAQVRAMWEMLISRGKDLHIEFGNIEVNENTGTVHWDAYYTFSSTGRKVSNAIDAYFEFENGKILKHTDSFDFYKWARQALGLTGLIFGHSNFLKQKIRAKAMQSLSDFMSRN